MPKTFHLGGVELGVEAGGERAPAAEIVKTPFRILLLGDFSGRANRGIVQTGDELARRRPILVDRDNFELVMEGMDIALDMPLDNSGARHIPVRFRCLDDFRPEGLFENLEIFRPVRALRERPGEPEPPGKPPDPPDAGSMLDTGGLLDRMAEQAGRGPTAPSSPPNDALADYVRKVVEPHLVPREDPARQERMARLNHALGELMRAIVHQPEFQALEAAWRAVLSLVRNLETGGDLKLYLLDISKEELAEDLADEDFESTGAYRLLVEQNERAPEAGRWTVWGGNYTFGPGVDDVALMGSLATLASQAGVPFVAAASPAIAGCDSLADSSDPRQWRPPGEWQLAWRALRRLSQAANLGLVLPRYLLRLPYGAETDPIEDFDFEEMPGTPLHEDYLWGNPAFLCLLMMAQGGAREVSGLPIHVYRENSESVIKPCAETLLTERAAESLIEAGLMPLLSVKDSDTVRLARVQSIADPPAPLAGEWRR